MPFKGVVFKFCEFKPDLKKNTDGISQRSPAMAVLSLEGFLPWFDPREPCGLGGAGQVHALFLITPALLFLAHSVGVNRGPGWLLHPSFSSLGLSSQLLGYQASQEVE